MGNPSTFLLPFVGEAASTLNQVCADLDRDIYPVVKHGGIVMPSNSVMIDDPMGEEHDHERKRTRRSTTGSGTGPSGGQRQASRPGQTGRSGSSDTETPVLSSSFWDHFEEQIEFLREEYSDLRIWRTNSGFWLVTRSRLLPNNAVTALIVTGIRISNLPEIRSWGFWSTHEWIGPRHTNAPDGSICAFEPLDNTWKAYDSLVSLFDLYSLWAVRHLYLKMYGRWPGRQSARFRFERITELREDEWCGCANPRGLYKDCCQPADRENSSIRDTIRYHLNFGMRQPPLDILRFIKDCDQLPDIEKVVGSTLIENLGCDPDRKAPHPA